MFRNLIELVKTVLILSKDLEQNRAEIKELRADVKRLTHALQHLVNEIEIIRQTDAKEHENLALKLENELLRFERKIPSALPPIMESESSLTTSDKKAKGEEPERITS
jgi:regulator of replication initiation timing